MESIVVLDFETTGLHPDQGDRITEVAALRLQHGKVVARYESLVNCERRLSASIRAFTGINQRMIDAAPFPRNVFPELLRFIGADPVISHNAAFDQGFLDCECERLHLQRIDNDFICTVQLARRLLPDLASHSLRALVRHFKLDDTAEHRAGPDAQATAQVLLKLCELAATQLPQPHLDAATLRWLACANNPSSMRNSNPVTGVHTARVA
ncbi:MAG: PolC-type DNA polymerase III [Steroidobacteraceae bacterium]